MTNAAFILEDSGFTRQQVDALTNFMDGSVATKADIERLDGKITAEIVGLDGKITAEIAGLDGKITAEIEKLIGKINLLYWMLGVSVAGTASLVIKAFST
ncbi:MAG: hypothetical protein GY862_00185 [Gammaproteobacteria bacterium]|nr:hypothetical protein [Gammaproteobacteria bacterium]